MNNGDDVSSRSILELVAHYMWDQNEDKWLSSRKNHSMQMKTGNLIKK